LDKIGIVSLGCSKNLVDSEIMIGLLKKEQYEITNNPEEAKVIIINTCGFIKDAKQESINTILEFAEYKKKGNCKYLIVTGCLAERYKNQIIEEIPEIDAIIGTGSFNKIVDVIKSLENNKKVCLFEDKNYDISILNLRRQLATPKYTAYLKIAEGCNNYCTYCIIPKLRGNYRSRKIEDILFEAKNLAKNGVKELILIAQDTTKYGIDIYGKYMLPKLLKELGKIENLKWIRLMYCYPDDITDELIYTIADTDKVCKYIDLPLQHSNEEILKKMNRKISRNDIENLIYKIRDNIPGIILRTTFIVGFPGETSKHFNDLIDFVKTMKFDKLGVFTFSREEGTPAYNMKGQVSEQEKERRKNILMEIQSKISLIKNREKIGSVYEVLIETKHKNYYLGRSYMDAPEIDGNIYIKSKDNLKLKSGEFVKIKILGASKYDLIGDVYNAELT